MKYNKKKIIYLKEYLKRKRFLKNEIKKKILKSIKQNLKIKPLIRINLIKNYNLKKKKNNNIFNKFCILTSKRRGINRNFFFSRHYIKKFGNWNELPNLKINSW